MSTLTYLLPDCFRKHQELLFHMLLNADHHTGPFNLSMHALEWVPVV